MSTLSVAVITDVQSFDFSNTEFAKAYNVANASFDQSNTAAIVANTTNTFAYGVAVNAAAAFAAANNVGPQIAPAFNTANASYNFANGAYASINSNWTVTNTVYGVANAAFASANNVAPQVTPAFNTANAAFGRANTALQNTNVTLAGNLFVTGTHTLVTVPNYRNIPHINSNYTISNTYNEMSIGPIFIANNVTVTVDNDANWVIV